MITIDPEDLYLELGPKPENASGLIEIHFARLPVHPFSAQVYLEIRADDKPSFQPIQMISLYGQGTLNEDIGHGNGQEGDGQVGDQPVLRLPLPNHPRVHRFEGVVKILIKIDKKLTHASKQITFPPLMGAILRLD